MTALTLFCLLLACSADVVTTLAVLRRGGYEVGSAWIIGAHPAAWKVVLWVGVLPVTVGALMLWQWPIVWPALLAAAAWRGYCAWRNNRLQRG